jgi:hypothetical protein
MPVCTNIPMIYEPKDDAGNLAETVINAAGDKYTEVAANLKFTCVKVKLNLIFDSSIAEFGGKTFSINSISADKLSPFTHLYWGGKFGAPTWTNNEEKEALNGLHLKHIIVETTQIARAVVDEVMYCRLS